MLYDNDKNYDEALAWHKLAAENGITTSYSSIALIYRYDLKNCKEAAKWYLKAIDAGSEYSITALLSIGTGMPEYPNTERDELLKSANNGDTKAQYDLAYLYYSGKNKYYDSAASYSPDYANAEKWYLEAAGNFDIGAYFPLGVLYQYVMKNPEQAIRWYKKAADAGNEAALVCLTDLGENYTPVPLSEESIEMLMQKAEDGDGEAQYKLASCYMFGSTVYEGEQDIFTPNYKMAEKWFIEAGENGNAADAYSSLGLMYSFRVINDDKAVYWYKKAAKAGDELAVDMLESYGIYYSKDGRDRLLEKAEAGNGQAQYELANCYEYGWKYYQSDNFGELPKNYENAENAKNGKERSAWFALGLMYDSMGKTDKAISALDLAVLYGSDLAAERLDKIKSRASSSSSSRSSSSGSRSSRTPDGLLAEGTYTISAQGRSTTTGQYTGVAGPDMKVEVKFYDDRITVNGYTYKYESTENGWKKYKGNVIKFGTGSTYTTYYVDSRYNMRRVDCSSFSYGMFGSTDWFTYDVVKGEVNIPDVYSPYGGGSYSTGSSSSESSSGSSYGSSRHQCSLCHGTGRIVRETPTGTFGTGDYKKKCDECGQYFYMSTGHSHVTCPQCHGKGYFTTD